VKDLQDWVLVALVAGTLLLLGAIEARSQEREKPQQRYQMYDSRGKYQGYVRESPYSGRCCNVYDRQGRQTGVVRPR
jgi:hypothetical protein